jgi:hypothetical protein
MLLVLRSCKATHLCVKIDKKVDNGYHLVIPEFDSSMLDISVNSNHYHLQSICKNITMVIIIVVDITLTVLLDIKKILNNFLFSKFVFFVSFY